MMALLLVLAFMLLQAIVLVASVGCYVHNRRVACYAVLYAPAIVFGLIAQSRGGEDWLVMLAIQAALSLAYNLHIISSAQQARG
jgi:hypothetical protein